MYIYIYFFFSGLNIYSEISDVYKVYEAIINVEESRQARGHLLRRVADYCNYTHVLKPMC